MAGWFVSNNLKEFIENLSGINFVYYSRIRRELLRKPIKDNRFLFEAEPSTHRVGGTGATRVFKY